MGCSMFTIEVDKNMFDVLDELELTTGTLDKIAILAKNSDRRNLKAFLYLAMDERVTFGIKKLPDYELMPGGCTFDTFKTLCDKLEARTLTGGAAISEIEDILEHCTPRENKWYRKCLQKDLACIGIGASLVNKAFGEKFILDFNCSGAKSEASIDKIDYSDGADAQWKVNGFRIFGFTDTDGKITRTPFCKDKYLIGRSGLPVPNFAFLHPYIESLGLSNKVFDGEVQCDDNLEEVQSLFNFSLDKTEDDYRGKTGKVGKGWADYLKRKAEIEDIISRCTFVLFEVLDRVEFEAEDVKDIYSVRRKYMEEVVEPLIEEVGAGDRLSVVPSYTVKDKAGAYAIAAIYFKQGKEGVVVKSRKGKYGFTKDNSQVKIKIKTDDVDCKIIGWEQAKTAFRTNGQPYPAMLGKLLVEYRNDRDEIKQSGVGTGKQLTRAFKLEFAANPELFLGRMCVCTSQEFTKDEGVMSCPRVEYLRPIQDKNKV